MANNSNDFFFLNSQFLWLKIIKVNVYVTKIELWKQTLGFCLLWREKCKSEFSILHQENLHIL